MNTRWWNSVERGFRSASAPRRVTLHRMRNLTWALGACLLVGCTASEDDGVGFEVP